MKEGGSKGRDYSTLIGYTFFVVHLGVFGGSGFLLAYSRETVSLGFLYLHGGFSISVYLLFYLAAFGVDEVKWMFINAGLGLFGIYSEIDWILSFFGTEIGDYPVYVHVVPFLYYVLYTFLLRQAFLDLTRSRENKTRRKFVESAYVLVSVAVYSYFLS